jgi:hypothetical protein
VSYELPAYSEASLKLLLRGFSKDFIDNQPEARVLYVIREPRGIFAEDPTRVAALVRDLLWIRQTNSETTNRNLRQSSAEAEHFGYYFGGLSGDVYAITQADVVDGGQVHLYGQELKEDGSLSASHFALMMPALPDAKGTLLRRGLISGATKGQAKRPAAGKIAILSPIDAEQLAIDLETIISQSFLIERSQGQPKPLSSRADLAFAALDYLQTEHCIGTLASHKRAKSSDDDLHTLLSLRKSFKYLVAPETKPVIDDITAMMFFDLLNPKVRERIEAARRTSFRSDLDEILLGILESWGMLDPLSIFQPASTADEDLKDEELLMIDELLGATVHAPSAKNG